MVVALSTGEAAMTENVDPERTRKYDRPQRLPFRITKIGHVVLNVTDLERSVKFYTEVLGFRISDVYPDAMMPGGMVFMRCNPDHHGLALIGGLPGTSANIELNHVAFELATLDEVVRARDHLKQAGIALDFEGRRRAVLTLIVPLLLATAALAQDSVPRRATPTFRFTPEAGRTLRPEDLAGHAEGDRLGYASGQRYSLGVDRADPLPAVKRPQQNSAVPGPDRGIPR